MLAGNRIKEQGAVWEVAGSRRTIRERRRDSFAEVWKGPGGAKGQSGQQVTVKRIPDKEIVQLHGFGTALSGQTKAWLPFCLCCLLPWGSCGDGSSSEGQGR